MSDHVIDIEHLYLSRQETEVFVDFSWKVKAQEHWFIMGNNGCGKTTLLDALMGYVRFQKGLIRVLGAQLGKVFIPDLRKKIGYVSPWIFKRMRDTMPVSKVVASGVDGSVGYWGDIPLPLQQKVAEQLEFFHCAHLAQRSWGSLSSGQQFKVILARASVNAPRLLLLDEPFSQLDIGARLKAYDFIERLAGQGKGLSVILVTHHLEDISDLYTHGLLFKDGQNYLRGPREEVLIAEAFNDIFHIEAKKLKFFNN